MLPIWSRILLHNGGRRTSSVLSEGRDIFCISSVDADGLAIYSTISTATTSRSSRSTQWALTSLLMPIVEIWWKRSRDSFGSGQFDKGMLLPCSAVHLVKRGARLELSPLTATPVEKDRVLWEMNTILFVLEAFCLTAIMGGAGLIEHPAEPTKDGCATIWRLAITALLQQLPGVSRLRVTQGSLGSESLKPTELMITGLPSLARLVDCHSVFQVSGATSIGKDEHGRYRTARLKEYPPALNRAMAHAFAESIERLPVDNSLHLPMLDVKSLLQAGFGKTYGPDFAPGSHAWRGMANEFHDWATMYSDPWIQIC